MALWTGCVLHTPTLFKEYVAWTNPDQASSIKNTEDFILNGILFCSEEKIRTDFQNTFAAICSNSSSAENNALVYLLGVLAKNFETISDKPARQYFELLNTLIDLNAALDDSSVVKAQASKVYNPEKLLS